MLRKKKRTAYYAFLLFLLLLLPIISLTTLPVSECSAEESTYTLCVAIDEPADGEIIEYCTNFNVTAHLNTPDDIINNVTARIEITGNAELVSGTELQTRADPG